MKTAQKKVPRNFRLEAELEAELTRRSKLTGIPETTILEEALRHHFAGNMRRVLNNAIAALGKGHKKKNHTLEMCSEGVFAAA